MSVGLCCEMSQPFVDAAGFGACGRWRAMQANGFFDINSCDTSKDIVVMFCFVFFGPIKVLRTYQC